LHIKTKFGNLKVMPTMEPNKAEIPRQKVYSISELTREIRSLLEGHFPSVWVEGEVSNLRKPSVGHLYFTLKDEFSQIRAVLFRGRQERIKFSLEDGMSVVCLGSVGVYEPKGDYQIIVEYMEPKGIGALQLAFEQLKERLKKEGLFDQERKRPLPFLPRKIGLVTSSSGAAIRDILNVVTRRFANVHIYLYPARVQGEGSANEIAEGIRRLNELDEIDVIIAARGGGSLEDLWAFNEEPVARAIFASRVPVISAVGHETDYTISDFVADVRAPTPSAAAEIVVQKKQDLVREVEALGQSLLRAATVRLAVMRASVEKAIKGLRDPLEKLRNQRARLIEAKRAIDFAIGHFIEILRKEHENLMAKLDTLSPLSILKRGYSITFSLPNMDIIKDVGSVERGDPVRVKVHRGEMKCTVDETKKQ